MQNKLPDFAKASVLVIGDIMLDEYWFGDALRISPEAPVPIVNIKQQDYRPGGAGNVALNIAALGAKVTLMGITGDDANGAMLKDLLDDANVQHDILELRNTRTITKLRVISRHQQLLRMDFEEKFSAFEPEALIQLFQKQLSSVNLVILSDYGKGTLVTTQKFIQLAHSANIPVLVDPKGTNFSIYQNADVITPNLKEFEAVVGACESEKEIEEKGQAFLSAKQIDALLLTRGERGMTLIQRGKEEIHLPAHAREVFDVTGAGDTVIAVLGAAIAAGSTLSEAMSLANLAASLVVAKLGAASVSAPELAVALTTSTSAIGSYLNEEQLLLAITDARMKGKRIVFTNGCFDILHAGHVRYLQQAKQLGDYLIVAINDDASVTRLKGTGRPINHVEQRASVLAGLGVVDWVVSFSDDTPERLLKKFKPEILVKGGDYTVDEVVGAPIVRAYGGEVRVLGVTKGLSTTSIIDKVVNQQKNTES